MISLDATARDGVARVELQWSDGRSLTRVRCGADPQSLPVACWRRGSAYHFALRVGAGPRSFTVKVTDGRGRATVTHPRHVLFEPRRGR